MRRILPHVLLGLGAFMVVVAVIAQTWAPGQVERTPLDTNDTTYLSGDATVPGDDLEPEQTPVLAFSNNRIDGDASDDDVAVWASSLCLVRDEGGIDGCVEDDDPAGRLISAEVAAFATDRHTGLTLNDPDYLPADATPQEGLQNKWPFGAEKKTYPVWDGVVGSAIDASFEGTKDLDGIETYVYRATADVDDVVVVGDIEGSYENVTDYYVEPRTGAIIDQVVYQKRTAPGVGTLLELDLRFTEDQVQKNIDDARDNISMLRTVETIVPIVGYAGGVVALIAAAVLIVSAQRRTREAAEPTARGDELAGV